MNVSMCSSCKLLNKDLNYCAFSAYIGNMCPNYVPNWEDSMNIPKPNKKPPMPEIIQVNTFSKGDIVEIGNKHFVVVSADNNENYFFVTTIDAFLENELLQSFSYSYSNSGWERIDATVKKVGHISLDRERSNI